MQAHTNTTPNEMHRQIPINIKGTTDNGRDEQQI
uniref:Uncharacterized protein n=1 Tax=Anguilla anguilla TaxID=7936 RepID=A0A0E9PHT9_ANGAN